jgi:hypothetical protein
MSTKRERIMQAILDKLQPLATANTVTGVYRSRADQYDRDEAPAIALWRGNETAERLVVPYVEKLLEVNIAVYTRGDVPDQLADPICQSVHAALFSDTTLGGLALDVIEVDGSLELDAADATGGWTGSRYHVWYRHLREDLTQ